MLMVSASEVGTLLISRTPYERADVERLREIAGERGFLLHYPAVPEHAGDKVYADLIEGRIGFLRDGGYNTEPPRDDSPYFFHVMTPFASSATLEEHAGRLTGVEVNWKAIVVFGGLRLPNGACGRSFPARSSEPLFDNLSG